MNYICPTVTAFDVHEYRSQLEFVCGFAGRIHIDLMDGDFTPTASPNPDLLWVPEGVEVDIHVMYRHPEKIIERLISFHPSLIIMHAESDADIPKLASTLREHNIKTGVALLPETAVADVNYILPHVQHALIFGGHLGYHGGQAELTQLVKVDQLRQIQRQLELGWDGGANLQNMAQLLKAGINVVNVGSGIHKAEHPEQAYATMVAKLIS
jgi:ribulose-phosphate 3-epimerase